MRQTSKTNPNTDIPSEPSYLQAHKKRVLAAILTTRIQIEDLHQTLKVMDSVLDLLDRELSEIKGA